MSEENSTGVSNKIGLILAIFAGLLALGMTFVFLNKAKKQATQPVSVASYSTKEILVAKRDLPSNYVLQGTNEDLKTVIVPDNSQYDDFLFNCVDSSHLQDVIGRRIGVALPANHPLMYSNLVHTVSLDDVFTDGYLKTITLDKENFFSSHLIPGDRVDVLVTRPVAKKNDEAAVSAALAPLKNGQTLNTNNLEEMTSKMMVAAMKPLVEQNDGTQEFESQVILTNAEVFMIGPMLEQSRTILPASEPLNENTNEITFRFATQEDAIRMTNFVASGAKISLLLRPRKHPANTASVKKGAKVLPAKTETPTTTQTEKK